MSDISHELALLSSPFPQEDVHWRAHTLTKKGDKALALAFIDARDVMDRFDQILGPQNWQDEYVESAKGRIICTIKIKVDGEWVSKSDGAGDTAVEGEKGGISDAFKRAAVKWGVGRYLYSLGSTWVPCETYKNHQNKTVFSKFTDNPWAYVKNAPKPTGYLKASVAEMDAGLKQITQDLLGCETIESVNRCAKLWAENFKNANWAEDYINMAKPKFPERRAELNTTEQTPFDEVKENT